MSKKKVLLIDGFSILFRAFYGMPLSMTSPDGIHTNAVFGFLAILGKVITDEDPDLLAVAFDRPEKTFRHTLYPEYKGTRAEAPDEFHEQVPVVMDLLAAMRIPVLTAPGFEADDVLGTLARRAEAEGDRTVIVSGDRDLLQIASEMTEIVIPKTRGGKTEYERYLPKDVEETYGVTPEAFIELKALMGDSSDNVPGLPGVGPKTAAKILGEFGTIENARAHLTEIKPNKAQEAMREHYDLLKLSKELVTIRTDAPVEYDPEALAIGRVYNEESITFLRKLGFRKLAAKYAEQAAAEEAAGTKKTGPEEMSRWTVGTETLADSAFLKIRSEKRIGFAIGEDGTGRPLFAAACAGKVFCFPPEFAEAKTDALPDLFSGMERVACTGAKKLVKKTGFRDAGILFDTVIAAYLLEPTKSDWDYDGIAAKCLGRTFPARKETLAAAKKSGDEKEMLRAAMEVAAREAEISFLAAGALEEELRDAEMLSLFRDVEMPLVPVLADMETEGILASREALSSYSDSLAGRIEELRKAVFEEAGEEFNLNSPKQLSEILFEKMGIPGGKKTKTGYSTAADVLEKLAPDHPVIAHILEYRTYAKLQSTYAEGLPAFIDEDGRIRTTFHQTITATGRLSSADPNLQNIPMRMELGRLIRKCFYPKDGCVFVDADYSQIELRILAHMSGDEQLIEAYRQAKDIHRTTASQVFHVPFDEVTDLMRRNAKAVNFGIVYGISAFGLSEGLSISREEAADYIRQYFATYPKIKAFLDGQVEKAKESGYAVSLFGRKRPVPELKETNFMRRSFGERVAMNAPIQGTAADIMKIAMIRVARRLADEGLRTKIILQIHDELLLEAPEEEAARASEILAEEMKNAASLAVPLEVDCHTGKTWYDAK